VEGVRVRVLFLWADSGSSNLGVRALAHGSLALARRAWGADLEYRFQDSAGRENGLPLGGREVVRNIGRRAGDISRMIASYDVIWDTGAGDSFADIYGQGRLMRMVYLQHLARRLGKPLVLGPQTIGPFRKRSSRVLARYGLRGASAIFTRDSSSTQYVARLTPRPVLANTDVVFALPRIEQARSRDVIVNISGLLWNANSHLDAGSYRKDVMRLCSELKAGGREVSILAHVVDNPTPDNDVPAGREVAAKLGLDFIEPVSLNDAREVLGSAQLVVGSRMHACLNAISMGTPTIPWAYSRKFAPLLSDLGWPHVLDLRTEADIVQETLRLAESGGLDAELVMRTNAAAEDSLSQMTSALSAIARSGGRDQS